MPTQWIKFSNSDSSIEIFDISQATHFKHIADGDDSFVEVYTGEVVHTVMSSIDPDAYRAVLDYIAENTGYTLY
ncbi:MAG: hypothetical protein GYB67_19760 [Chloroflexi bacterium]|nr:hypothetical protein [Chloroflexota bacterium]